MNGFKLASRFVSRIVLGSIIAILLGGWLDKIFHVAPLFTILILLYVLIGTPFLLIKEIERGSKKTNDK